MIFKNITGGKEFPVQRGEIRKISIGHYRRVALVIVPFKTIDTFAEGIWFVVSHLGRNFSKTSRSKIIETLPEKSGPVYRGYCVQRSKTSLTDAMICRVIIPPAFGPFAFRCPASKRSPSWIIRQILPFLTWMRAYHASFLEYDIIAGISVGLTVIPQSIAYAAIAGLPVQYGLYTSFMGAFIYAITGTSKDVSLGPTTVMALLVAQKAAEYPADADKVAVIILLTFYTGCVQLAMGIFQLGFFVDFVSLAVSKAFIAAAAVIIAGEQLKGLLGLKIPSDHFLVVVYDTFAQIKQTNYWDLILGVCCIISLIILKYVAPKPGFVRVRWYDKLAFQTLRLVSNARYAIVVCAASAIEGALLSQNIDVLTLPHDVVPGLPPVAPPQFHVGNSTNWQTFKSLGSSLVVFPLISLLELLTIAKSFAQENRYTINSSQEFRAVGIANIVSSFFSSYPLTASFSRSALNAQCGVRTPAAGIVTGGIAILATAFLTGWLHFVPKASLAAVIMCAVLPNIDLSVANKMWKVRKGDLFPYIVTLLACFAVGIEYGVLIGIFVSVGLVLFPLARPTVAVYHSNNSTGQEIIVTPYGNIHFPAIGYMRKLIIEHIEMTEMGPGRVVIDGSHWTDLDYSVAARMKDLIKEVQNLGWEINFSEMSDMVSGTFDTPVIRRPRRTGSQDSIISRTDP
ncbi:Sodium-independent sulfate anion transporter [Hypsibius exemplaris]|uniref:Sodium-independent sulfate anion transporter n=1 Tax=Hypsibius exemplaris TaxID=2072580 RepID=A0A1W0WH79_HYPEX|nr:Sodium-independent sulfate anion transporter [Hypsibius exemplaris]